MRASVCDEPLAWEEYLQIKSSDGCWMLQDRPEKPFLQTHFPEICKQVVEQ
jgi:hypothetical protein